MAAPYPQGIASAAGWLAEHHRAGVEARRWKLDCIYQLPSNAPTAHVESAWLAILGYRSVLRLTPHPTNSALSPSVKDAHGLCTPHPTAQAPHQAKAAPMSTPPPLAQTKNVQPLLP